MANRRDMRSRRPPAPARRSFLVFTEGERTEVDYLNGWRRELRTSVTITVSPLHGTPMTLVDAAVKQARSERRTERSKGKPYDEIWCIFDTDDHPDIPKAEDKAKGNDIGIARSNPCFELWLLLHYADHSRFEERDVVRRMAEAHTKCSGKRLTDSALTDLISRSNTAIARARQLAERHVFDGRSESHNPSSGVGRLVETLRARSGSG